MNGYEYEIVYQKCTPFCLKYTMIALLCKKKKIKMSVSGVIWGRPSSLIPKLCDEVMPPLLHMINLEMNAGIRTKLVNTVTFYHKDVALCSYACYHED